MLKNHSAIRVPGPIAPDWATPVPTWGPEGNPPVTIDGPNYECRRGSTEVPVVPVPVSPPSPGGRQPYEAECTRGPIKSAVVYEYVQTWYVRVRQSKATGEVQRCENCNALSDGVIASGPKADFVTDTYGAYHARKMTRSEACEYAFGPVARHVPVGFPDPILVAETVFR